MRNFLLPLEEHLVYYSNEKQLLCACFASQLGLISSTIQVHEWVFLHGNLLREAVWSRKIQVQVMCSCAVWTWLLLEKTKLGPDVHAWRYIGKCCGCDWSFPRCFRSRIHCTHIWRFGDVMTFESLTLTPFWFEKSSVRKEIFNV